MVDQVNVDIHAMGQVADHLHRILLGIEIVFARNDLGEVIDQQVLALVLRGSHNTGTEHGARVNGAYMVKDEELMAVLRVKATDLIHVLGLSAKPLADHARPGELREHFKGHDGYTLSRIRQLHCELPCKQALSVSVDATP